jgi:hypothetical protein
VLLLNHHGPLLPPAHLSSLFKLMESKESLRLWKNPDVAKIADRKAHTASAGQNIAGDLNPINDGFAFYQEGGRFDHSFLPPLGLMFLARMASITSLCQMPNPGGGFFALKPLRLGGNIRQKESQFQNVSV